MIVTSRLLILPDPLQVRKLKRHIEITNEILGTTEIFVWCPPISSIYPCFCRFISVEHYWWTKALKVKIEMGEFWGFEDRLIPILKFNYKTKFHKHQCTTDAVRDDDYCTDIAVIPIAMQVRGIIEVDYMSTKRICGDWRISWKSFSILSKFTIAIREKRFDLAIID